jgi:predicted MFS family arabinose efflux permease
MILFFAALITATGSLPVLVLGTYAVQLSATYGLGNTELGLFISIFFGMGALASFLAGRWARSEDWLRVTVVAGALSLFVVMSLAWTILGDSKWVLAFLMIVGGLSFALAAPIATRAIMSAVPPGRGGLWFGVKQAGVPMAAVMCGGSLWLVADSLGWRIGATSCGALIVLNLIVGQVLRRGNDASAVGARRLQDETALLYPNADRDPDPSNPRPHDEQPIRPTLYPRQQAALLMTAIAVMCACVLVSASQSFFVVSAQSKGLSLGTAGALLAIGSLVGVALRIVFGMWTDHKGLRELRVVAILLLFGVVGALLLALPGIAAVYFGGALMFAFGWGWQGLFHLGLVRAVPSDPTMATGIGMTGAALGMTIGAPIFGVVSSEWGFSQAWLVTGLLATLGVIAFFVSDLLLHPRTTQVEPPQRGAVLR